MNDGVNPYSELATTEKNIQFMRIRDVPTRLFWMRSFRNNSSVCWTEFIAAFIKDYHLNHACNYRILSIFQEALAVVRDDVISDVYHVSPCDDGNRSTKENMATSKEDGVNTDTPIVITVEMIDRFVPPGVGLFNQFQTVCDPGTLILWVGNMGLEPQDFDSGDVTGREDLATTGGFLREFQSLLGEHIVQVVNSYYYYYY